MSSMRETLLSINRALFFPSLLDLWVLTVVLGYRKTSYGKEIATRRTKLGLGDRYL